MIRAHSVPCIGHAVIAGHALYLYHSGDSADFLELRTVSYPHRKNRALVMKSMEIQPVITSLVADYMMRAKLTLWRVPGAKVNGGWCMCMTKQDYDGPKVCKCSFGKEKCM